MSDDVDKGSAAMRGSLDGEPTREQAAFHRWQEFCKSCGFRLYDTPEAMSAFLEGLRCGRAEPRKTLNEQVFGDGLPMFPPHLCCCGTSAIGRASYKRQVASERARSTAANKGGGTHERDE